MSVIKLKEVSKIYEMGENRVTALNQVTLDIAPGEFTAIVGPSGSGKSTMMNLIGCLDTPSGGSVEVNGEKTGRLSPARLASLRNREIGFIFQHFNLLPRIDIRENVELPLLYAGVAGEERRQLSLKALNDVGLGNRTGHLPTELSGGQKQRVAVARALVNDPALLLADEPTGALDSKTGEMIMDLFREINGRGRTVVIVTHNEEVARQCGRVITLKDGEVTSSVMGKY